MDAALSERLVAFWTRHGALDEQGARERLADVVCVLSDAGEEIAGVSVVRDERVPLMGNRRMWTLGMFLGPGLGADAALDLAGATRAELERHSDGSPGAPLGLFALFGDRALLRDHPEAFWPESGLLYAGYAPDGRQIRLGLFEGAVV